MIDLEKSDKVSHPPARYEANDEQLEMFKRSLAYGYTDVAAALKARIPLSAVTDVVAQITPEKCAELRAMTALGVAEVNERAERLMLAANDLDAPMTLKDALDILERRDPTRWGKKQTLQLEEKHSVKLPDEERARLAIVFGVAKPVEVLEGEKVQQDRPVRPQDAISEAQVRQA